MNDRTLWIVEKYLQPQGMWLGTWLSIVTSPFACTESDCDMAFKRQDALTNHLRVHVNVKSMSAATQDVGDTLQVKDEEAEASPHPQPAARSLRIRAGKKNNTGKIHSAGKNESNHLAIVDNDNRPFGFKFCTSTFKREGNLFMHLKRQHGMSEMAAWKLVYGENASCKSTNNKIAITRSSRTPLIRAAAHFAVRKQKENVAPQMPKPRPKRNALEQQAIIIIGNRTFYIPGLLLSPDNSSITRLIFLRRVGSSGCAKNHSRTRYGTPCGECLSFIKQPSSQIMNVLLWIFSKLYVLFTARKDRAEWTWISSSEFEMKCNRHSLRPKTGHLKSWKNF